MWDFGSSIFDFILNFLAYCATVLKLGGFETLEKWETGAFAGHTAVCLNDEFDNHWFGESGHDNEKVKQSMALCFVLGISTSTNPVQNRRRTPTALGGFETLEKWETGAFAGCLNDEFDNLWFGESGHDNEKYVREAIAGLIFSWIDTIADKYPPPLDAHLIQDAYMLMKIFENNWKFLPWCNSEKYNALEPYANMNENCPSLLPTYERLVIYVMSMWTRMQPAYVANMWNEALNRVAWD
ncbi:hypothetical protein U1Q18_016980 [Sarracenia purpurea var. burkii]